MTKYQVSIKGVAPLLQHRFPEEDNPEIKSKKKKLVHNSQEDAEKALYRDEKGNVYHPADHILGALSRISTRFQMEKRRTYKEAVQGGVLVEPDCIPLKSKWVVDRRPVVVQRARIMRSRPRFDQWELTFAVVVLDERLEEHTLKQMLDDAGQYIGIGDFRPRFGRFIVTEFKALK